MVPKDHIIAEIKCITKELGAPPGMKSERNNKYNAKTDSNVSFIGVRPI
jgi:hypothetical protein